MVLECPSCDKVFDNRRGLFAHHSREHPNRLEDRFWYDVDIGGVDECWEWQGSTTNGYGYLRRGGECYRAHRYAWLVERGEIGSQCVLHHCDNRRCVNPTHLYLGGAGDNIQDAWDRDRRPTPTPPENPQTVRGEEHPNSKLSESDVIEMRELSGDVSQKELAAEYEISQSMVSKIIRREKWSHVDSDDGEVVG